jgi:hypothetical protein
MFVFFFIHIEGFFTLIHMIDLIFFVFVLPFDL